MATSKLKRKSERQQPSSPHGIVKLLLVDHRLMRSLMTKVKSKKSSDKAVAAAFHDLEKVVASHVKAEETTFLALIRDHPRFDGVVLEGYEEHRVHEVVLSGIHKVRDHDRKIQQMKIFCEILEHHLDEEEEKLFPRFKKYAATSTRKKIGTSFVKVRKATADSTKGKGAARLKAKS